MIISVFNLTKEKYHVSKRYVASRYQAYCRRFVPYKNQWWEPFKVTTSKRNTFPVNTHTHTHTQLPIATTEKAKGESTFLLFRTRYSSKHLPGHLTERHKGKTTIGADPVS